MVRAAAVASLVVLMLAAGNVPLPAPHLAPAPTRTGPPMRSAPYAGRAAPVGPSWGSYMYDANRSGDNPNETTISPRDVGGLHLLWQDTVGGAVEDQPLVAFGHVYVAGWDGYEYAYNVSNGSLDWRTYIGQTQFSNCYASKPRGTTATPTIENGTLYTLGGDPYLYALDARNGTILWKVSENANNPSSGNYNWASPVIYGSTAYVGLSSACNNPGSQGMILSINLNGSTHSVQHTFAIVPSGQDGGGVWSTGGLDAQANILWMTTGDEVSASSGYYRAVIALNATTLKLIGYWQQPTSGTDFDFGAGPTLFNDSGGRALVAATNKNGQVYAFNRSNVSASGWKPIWVDNVSWYDNASPQQACGCALAPAAFDGSTLYLGGGYARLPNGTKVAGSVRAVVPSNGTPRWIHVSPGIVRAGLTVANGLVYDAADPNDNRSGTLEVLNATDGARLFAYSVNQTINAPVTVADGRVYFVSANWNNSGTGHLYALGFSLSTNVAAPGGDIPVGATEAYSANSSGGTPPYRYAWDFGDGSPNGTGAAVQHAFDQLGNFTSTLTTTDAVGATASTTWVSRVVPVPLSVVDFRAAPNPVVVNSSVSILVNVSGGFGALSPVYAGLPPGCGTSGLLTFNCTPDVPATYPVEVTVHDAVGTMAHAFLNLTVLPEPPPGPAIQSLAWTPPTIALGATAWLNATITGGAAPLSFAYSGLPPGCSGANGPSLECTPSGNGSFAVRLNVSDGRGMSAAATAVLTVLSPPVPVTPQITSFTVTPATVDEGQNVTFHLALGGTPSRDSIGYRGLPRGCASQNSTQLTCAPAVVGNFTVVALVTDLSGAAAQANATLVVHSPIPPAGPARSSATFAGLPVLAWWAIGVAAVVLAVLLAVVRRRIRRPP